MKPLHLYHWALVAGLWICLLPAVHAADERAILEETRRVQTERLDAQARDCATRFATTRCQDKTRAERLRIEAQLRQREAVLNDAERQLRAQEQLERNRQKADAHAQKFSSSSAAPERRALTPKAAPQPGGIPRADGAQEVSTPLTEAQRRMNASNYERKQAQALAKRAEVAKNIKAKGASKTPLPTSP